MRLTHFLVIALFQLISALGLAQVPEHLWLDSAVPSHWDSATADSFRRLKEAGRASVAHFPESARIMIDMELNANPAADRSAAKNNPKREMRPLIFEHFEIPLNALERSVGLGLAQSIHESMVFNRQGEKFVRWILNPEDTEFGIEMEKWLVQQGLDARRYMYYVGYLTASRSCIVRDPGTGVTFSIKSSTNQTGGIWKNKKETVRAAKAGRLMSDFLTQNIDASELHALGIIKEPLAFYAASVDQGIIVRQYDHFLTAQQDLFLIPAFSAGHTAKGKEIAARNGSTDPAEFWAKHMMAPLGKALAELVLFSGVVYNSPHGQNFMIEVDKNMKPTGRIFAKDYADANIQRKIMTARGGGEVVSHYEPFSQNLKYYGGEIIASVNPLYSGYIDLPDWLNGSGSQSVDHWKSQFIQSFQQRGNEIMNLTVPGHTLPPLKSTYGWNDSYWTWETVLSEQVLAFHLKALQDFSSKARSRSNGTLGPSQQIRQKPVQGSAGAAALPVAGVGSFAAGAVLMDFGSLRQELIQGRSLDRFQGGFGQLLKMARGFSLQERKDVNFLFDMSLQNSVRATRDAKTLMEFLELMYTLDPVLIMAINDFEEKVKAATTNAELIDRAYLLKYKLQDHLSKINDIKSDDPVRVRRGIENANLVMTDGTLYQSLADAFAYKLNRTSDPQLKLLLFMGLARYGRGDQKVIDFLKGKLNQLGVSAEQQRQAESALLRSSNSCSRIFGT